MSEPPTRQGGAFSAAFDSAVSLCVESQRLLARSAELMARARALKADRQRRHLVRDAHANLSTMSVLFDTLQHEVEDATDRLRGNGVGEEETLVIVRARVRFVLYDGDFAQQEAEPMVDRVEGWVRRRYRAA